MIATFHHCTSCQSTDVIRNGKNSIGNAKFRCKACGFSGVIQTKRKSVEEKERVVAAYQERASARGVGRVFGISHQTTLTWVKKKAARSAN